MFTGIISDIGRIERIEKSGDWTVKIAATKPLADVALGASIACDGICLTVISKADKTFTVQLSAETVTRTVAQFWQPERRINLERALRMGDELGGHLVSGHVDGIAVIVGREPEKDSLRFRIEAPRDLVPFLAPKGSVTLDGISLTVNEVQGNVIGINIIPHTQHETTLGAKQTGEALNIEIDLIARYVGRMMKDREV